MDSINKCLPGLKTVSPLAGLPLHLPSGVQASHTMKVFSVTCPGDCGCSGGPGTCPLHSLIHHLAPVC